MKKHVLITIPHAKANNHTHRRVPVHPFDYAAEHVGREIAKELSSHADIRVTLLVADVAREHCDLNRGKRCDSESHFRTRFLNEISAGSSSVDYVLDVHSYPVSETWKLSPDSVRDGVLLYAYRSALSENEASYLSFVLRHNNLMVAAVPGSEHENFIIDQASARNIKSVLLEVNESSQKRAPLIKNIVNALVARLSRTQQPRLHNTAKENYSILTQLERRRWHRRKY